MTLAYGQTMLMTLVSIWSLMLSSVKPAKYLDVKTKGIL